jgi:hypothetical protein
VAKNEAPGPPVDEGELRRVELQRERERERERELGVDKEDPGRSAL